MANFSQELTDLNAADDIIIPIEIKIPSNERPGRSLIIATVILDKTDYGPIADLLVDHDYNPPEHWNSWNPAKGPLLKWIVQQTEKTQQFFK